MIGEKPLENMVSGYSNTSIFRTIAFIGYSLSSGQFETVDADGKHNYYNFYEYSWGQFIARKNGLTAYNFSYGGLTTKSYIENFAEENGYAYPRVITYSNDSHIYKEGLPTKKASYISF
jgi:hypothetical protein